jgi:hypothetical protein
MKFEEKTGAENDQRRAKHKRERDSQEKAHRAATVARSFGAWKKTLCRVTILQYRPKHFHVSGNPELDFIPGLPEQIEPGTDDQHADDSEQLRQS